MDGQKGQYEMLMGDIVETLRDADGGWRITETGRMVIDTRIPDRPELSNNGGNYYHYRKYQPTGLGVEVWDDWSCDICDYQYSNNAEYKCVVSLKGLERMAKLATLEIAAEAWVKKVPGSMKYLKDTIRALA